MPDSVNSNNNNHKWGNNIDTEPVAVAKFNVKRGSVGYRNLGFGWELDSAAHAVMLSAPASGLALPLSSSSALFLPVQVTTTHIH